MSGAELGLAIVATIDLCLKYGKNLVELCKSIKNAGDQLFERCVRLESIWVRTKCQLDFLRSIWTGIGHDLRRVQEQNLDVLIVKLKAAIKHVQDITRSPNGQILTKTQRIRYAFGKEGLDKSLAELEDWQSVFDPSWYLTMRASSSQIDQYLSNTDEPPNHTALTSANDVRIALRPISQDQGKIFLAPEGLEVAQLSDILFSTVKLARRKGSSKWLALDTLHLPLDVNPSRIEKDVRDVARKLRHSDPWTFHLFNCSGVIRYVDSESAQPISFTFVFKLPQGISTARSLRDVLHEGSVAHSLSDRLQIAKGLASAVSYVHNFGFVHKNIHPETIVLLKDKFSVLGTPFLVGFEAVRSADGQSWRKGRTAWYLNLYQHPNRQGEKPTEDYIMQHDIYSLGVCLLELGMFGSFVVYDQQAGTTSASPMLPMTSHAIEMKEPELIKQCLLDLSRTELPRRMGTKYARLVTTCLSCLDEDNNDFGDKSSFQDEDGILISVRYIEKVRRKSSHRPLTDD